MTEPIVVIGNGPAGMTVAHSLRDYDPLVVSPTRKPSPSTCGGVLTAPSTEMLRRNNWLEPLMKHGGKELTNITVHAQSREVFKHQTRDGEVICFDRNHFDRLLWKFLNSGDLRHYEGYITDLTSRKRELTLSTRSGKQIKTKGVIDCSGHRRVSQPNNQCNDVLIGTEWHISDDHDELNSLHLILGERWYAGVSPTGTGHVTCSAVTEQEIFQRQGPEAFWDKIYSALGPNLSESISSTYPGNITTKAGFWQVPTSDSIGQQCVPVGDALGFTMPLSGEGIAMAIQEAHAMTGILNTMNNADEIFPLSRQHRRALINHLVVPFRKQLGRWNRIHWMGMNGGWILALASVWPKLIEFIFERHKPVPSQWNYPDMSP